jgi:ubiquinone/menaquinone biosynthesis C-methylase UbiE
MPKERSTDTIYKELKKRKLVHSSKRRLDLKNYNRLQSDFFDKTIDIFTKPLPLEIQASLKRIVSLADLKPKSIILDVGTGTGALIPYFFSYKPKRIIACDLSKKMLSYLKKEFPQVETYLMDVKDLSLKDKSVDAVFFNAVWANIGDKEGALKNIKRMLKPKGKMIISHPEGKEFVDELSKTMPFPLDPLPDEKSLTSLLKNYGFMLKIYIDEPKFFFALALLS